MNKNSNVYTIIYAAVMVILVAVGLAFTSQALKDRQHKNENIDKMQQILRSLNIHTDTKQTITKYNEVIKDAFMIDADGNIIENSKGTKESDPAFSFEISTLKHSTEVPVFIAEVEGQTKYICAMYGAGLWGPIWGYLALNDDRNTIYGADFSHASETPVLGAKITEPWFPAKFVGKHLFYDGDFKSVGVVKVGHSASEQDYVDGISGSTLTSRGVNDMMFDSMNKYKNFLSKHE